MTVMQKLTDEQLLELLNDTESDRAERKEAFKGDATEKAREAVCAFANDLPGHNRPGVLFVGAKDNGEPGDLEVTDQLLRSLADMRSDGNILPLPVLLVEKRTLKGADMVVVTVMPSDMPPVRYKGRIWIRTGPRRAVASGQEERILNEKRRYKDLPFDLHPVSVATLADLSKTVFENEYLPAAFAPDVLEQNDRSYEERLASCKMFSLQDGVPTILGLIAIGKKPRDFLPGNYIQFLRIDGTELADPVVDSREVGGDIVTMLRLTEEKLIAHNRVAVDILSGPTHRIDSDYPHSALQQILYNAVLHRAYENNNAPVRVYWYNDRIEITSPGGPYGDVTAENFGQPGITAYRNPNIADVLKTFDFIQAFGRGIATANQEMKRNGNPPPEFKVSQSLVVCTLKATFIVWYEERAYFVDRKSRLEKYPNLEEKSEGEKRKLVDASHELVKSIAREYTNEGLPLPGRDIAVPKNNLAGDINHIRNARDRGACSIDDLIQAGVQGMEKAVGLRGTERPYDRTECRFSTYASWRVNEEIRERFFPWKKVEPPLVTHPVTMLSRAEAEWYPPPEGYFKHVEDLFSLGNK